MNKSLSVCMARIFLLLFIGHLVWYAGFESRGGAFRAKSAHAEVAGSQKVISRAIFYILDMNFKDVDGDGIEDLLANSSYDGLHFTVDGGPEMTLQFDSYNNKVINHADFVAALQKSLADLIAEGSVPADTTLTVDNSLTRTVYLDDGSVSPLIPAIVLESRKGILKPSGFVLSGGIPVESNTYTETDSTVSPDNESSTVAVLTRTSPDITISFGQDLTVYGTEDSNKVTLESGARAELLNFSGDNVISIQAESDRFSVFRSGSVVTLEGTDGTMLKIPATQTPQMIVFNDGQWPLLIQDGQVVLGEQNLSLTPSAIQPLSNIEQLYFANGDSASVFPGNVVSFRIVAVPVKKPGNFDYQLESAPHGMRIDANGVVTWNVPKSTDPNTTHSFTVKVNDLDNNGSLSLTGHVFVMKGKEIASATVDAAGGKMESISGVIVNVPAGSVSEPTQVKILEGRDEENNPVITIDTPVDMDVEVTLPDPNTFGLQYGQKLSAGKAKYGMISSEYPLVYPYIVKGNKAWFTSHGLKYRCCGKCNPDNSTLSSVYTLKEAYTLKGSNPYPGKGKLDGEAILFIHGYTPDGDLGGGEGTWKNFPALVGQLRKNGHNFVPFEFRWRTNDTFEAMANDLGKSLEAIVHVMKTHKKVHIIAHSFGGILARTLLQKLNRGADYRGYVASLTTLGTPHSGIFDKETTVDGINFPGGQDSSAFELAGQISTYQMGEFDLNSGVFEYAAGVVDGNPGELAAKLAKTTKNIPDDLPIQVLIGLRATIFNLGTFNWRDVGKGDGLISYEGQRFHPSLAESGLLRKSRKFGGIVYESVLGAKPGFSPAPGTPPDFSNKWGYKHSPFITKISSSSFITPEAKVSCSSVESCTHASFLEVKKFLTGMGNEEELQAPTGVKTVLIGSSNEKIRVTWNAVDGADFYKVQWKKKGQSQWNTESGISTTSYDHPYPELKRTYCYRVVAVKGDLEKISKEVEFTLPNSDPVPGTEDTFTNKFGMKFVRIKAGSFMMGAKDDDPDAYGGEKPRHEVRLTRDFICRPPR